MYCPSQIFHMAYVCFQQRAYQAPSSGISIYIQKNINNHLQLQLPKAQLNVLPAHTHPVMQLYTGLFLPPLFFFCPLHLQRVLPCLTSAKTQLVIDTLLK